MDYIKTDYLDPSKVMDMFNIKGFNLPKNKNTMRDKIIVNKPRIRPPN